MGYFSEMALNKQEELGLPAEQVWQEPSLHGTEGAVRHWPCAVDTHPSGD